MASSFGPTSIPEPANPPRSPLLPEPSANVARPSDDLQQYEIVWVRPQQHVLAGFPEGFGLEIVDFLGPGDLDARGQRTVWVRGPMVEAISVTDGVRLVRGDPVAVAIPHDQPRARRRGGAILPPAALGTVRPS